MKRPLSDFGKVRLKGTLHNLDASVATTQEYQVYGRGVLVGVVGTLMALDYTFEQAVRLLCDPANQYLPPCLNMECVPQPWRTDFTKALWSYTESR